VCPTKKRIVACRPPGRPWRLPRIARCRVPIFCHLCLALLVRVFGFFLGCAGASFLNWAAGQALLGDRQPKEVPGGIFLVLASMVVMFSSAVGGIRLGNAVVCCFPARCPECGERVYATGCSMMVYECSHCGFVRRHKTERG